MRFNKITHYVFLLKMQCSKPEINFVWQILEKIIKVRHVLRYTDILQYYTSRFSLQTATVAEKSANIC